MREAINRLASRQYVMLMRHADHETGVLTEGGRRGVEAVARRLADWMDGQWRCSETRSLSVMITASPEVRETATVLRTTCDEELRRLRAQHPGFSWPDVTIHAPEELPDAQTRKGHTDGRPDPRVLGAYTPDRPQVNNIAKQLSRPSEDAYPLLIGNDPFVGWIASELASIRLGPSTVWRRRIPIARGEMICLSHRSSASRDQHSVGGWRLEWNLAPNDQREEQGIREKIKSKMTTATALGTVIVALTTFLLQNALRDEPSAWEWLAVAALEASTALYFSALFLYDTLQMPTRFWGSSLSVGKKRVRTRLRRGTSFIRRPPSSTARVLQGKHGPDMELDLQTRYHSRRRRRHLPRAGRLIRRRSVDARLAALAAGLCYCRPRSTSGAVGGLASAAPGRVGLARGIESTSANSAALCR